MKRLFVAGLLLFMAVIVGVVFWRLRPIEIPEDNLDTEWVSVESREYQFRTEMPDTPQLQEKKTADGFLVTEWAVQEKGGTLAVSAGISPLRDDQVNKEVLDAMRDAAVQRMKGTMIRDSEVTRNGKYTGRLVEFEVPSKNVEGKCLVIQANGVLYSLMVLGSPYWKRWNSVDRFFDSFQVIP